jgi:hypothetical protein
MREIRPSGSEGGAGFYPSFLPLSRFNGIAPAWLNADGWRFP